MNNSKLLDRAIENGFVADPDFRRTPKTDCFCYMCQKDIKGSSSTVFLSRDDTFVLLKVADVCDLIDVELIWPVLIGPECEKQVPVDYKIRNVE